MALSDLKELQIASSYQKLLQTENIFFIQETLIIKIKYK